MFQSFHTNDFSIVCYLNKLFVPKKKKKQIEFKKNARFLVFPKKQKIKKINQRTFLRRGKKLWLKKEKWETM